CLLGHKLHTNADPRSGRWLQRPSAPVDQTIIPAQNRARSGGQWSYVAEQKCQFITRHRPPVPIARRESWGDTVLRNHIHASVTRAGIGQWDPNCYTFFVISAIDVRRPPTCPRLGIYSVCPNGSRLQISCPKLTTQQTNQRRCAQY